MSRSIFKSQSMQNFKDKFWKFNPKTNKLHRIIVEFRCRILSFYEDDPRDETLLILNHQEIKLINKNTNSPIKYLLAIINDSKETILEFGDDDLDKVTLWKDKLNETSFQTIKSNYKYLEEIYDSPHSKVIKAQSYLSLKYCAIKLLSYLGENTKDSFYRGQITHELCILKKLNHYGLIQILEVYDENGYIAIVMEYVSGKNLYQHMKDKKKYDELNASKLIVNLLMILKYIGDHNIVHKDIKPSNIMLCNPYDDTSIKLIDFGLSSFIYSTNINIPCGTPGYLAPEIFNKSNITNKTDIYACGLILYYILSGEMPFYSKDSQTTIDINKKGEIEFNGPKWTDVSYEAKQFMIELLDKNPNKRPTIHQALQSKWIRKYNNINTINERLQAQSSSTLCPLTHQTIPEICLFGNINTQDLRVVLNKASKSKANQNSCELGDIYIKREYLKEENKEREESLTEEIYVNDICVLSKNKFFSSKNINSIETETLKISNSFCSPKNKRLSNLSLEITSCTTNIGIGSISYKNMIDTLDSEDYNIDIDEKLPQNVFSQRTIINKGIKYL